VVLGPSRRLNNKDDARRHEVETNKVAERPHGGAIEKQWPGSPDDWRDDALCLQFDGDMWFPEKGASPAVAKLLCGRCEVRGECLEFALDTHEEFGIWGGLSTAERRALRRRRRLRRALDRAGVDLPYELDEPGCGLSLPDGEAA
jgi:WhiB family redox-sensing transcriptional regulator